MNTRKPKYFAIVYNPASGLWEDSGLPSDVLEVLAGEIEPLDADADADADADEICSAPECDQPVAGWCATCAEQGTYGSGRGESVEQLAPTWCAEHLAAHCAAARASREHTPHWLAGNGGAE